MSPVAPVAVADAPVVANAASGASVGGGTLSITKGIAAKLFGIAARNLSLYTYGMQFYRKLSQEIDAQRLWLPARRLWLPFLEYGSSPSPTFVGACGKGREGAIYVHGMVRATIISMLVAWCTLNQRS